MESPFQHITEKEMELAGIKDIVIAGDVGCTGFNEESKKVFEAILRMETDLFFILGDITCNGSKEEFDEIGDFAGQRTGKPIFTLCGNHDIPGYQEFSGFSCYALVLGRTVMFFLNNSTRFFKDEDLEFLKESLEKYKEKMFVILFHVPPLFEFHKTSMPLREWDRLRMILDQHRERIQCLICAHRHGFYEYDLDGYAVFLTAGGGASMIYELPKNGLKIHNVLKMSLGETGAVDVGMIPISV